MTGSPLAVLNPRWLPVAEAVAGGAELNGKLLTAFGWPERSARVRASEIKKDRAFIEAVRYLLDHRISGLVPLALSTLEKELRDGGKDRIKAALIILDRGGFGPHSTSEHVVRVERSMAENLRELAKINPDLAATVRKGLGLPDTIDGEFRRVESLPSPAATVADELEKLGIFPEDTDDETPNSERN